MKQKQPQLNGRKRRRARGRRMLASLMGAMFLTMSGSIMTFAAGEGAGAGFDGTVNALNTLKTGLFAIIAGVGVILIGKNIMELSTAFQQQDSASMNNAIKGLIAGGLMAAVGTIVTALGFA